MPSKSDIQFGKIVVTNHFATKEEVESSIKAQARFERERHTIILEALLLHKDYLTLDQIEAIQKKMERRVVFCEKCHGKFNVFQFRGSEKFLCHKCGNRVTVPDKEQYRNSLRDLASKVEGFFSGEPEVLEPAPEPLERETIMIRREDIVKAKGGSGEPEASEDEVLEPVEEVEGDIEEEELEVEIESEVEEESGLDAAAKREDWAKAKTPPEGEKILVAKVHPSGGERPEAPLKAEPVESTPQGARGKGAPGERKFRKLRPKGLKKGAEPASDAEKGPLAKGKLKKRPEDREGKSRFRKRR